MAHRRSHAVIDSNFLRAVNEVESPSLQFNSPSQKKRSAFKAGKQSHLKISIPPDNFTSYYNVADTKDGEPVAPRSCLSLADEATTLDLIRHMSITPRSNSSGSNSSLSFTPIKPKTPEPSVPLFLVSSWDTPAVLKNEYRIVGILGK